MPPFHESSVSHLTIHDAAAIGCFVMLFSHWYLTHFHSTGIRKNERDSPGGISAPVLSPLSQDHQLKTDKSREQRGCFCIEFIEGGASDIRPRGDDRVWSVSVHGISFEDGLSHQDTTLIM